MIDLKVVLKRAMENRCIEEDQDFAKLLEIDPSTLSKIKSGKRSIGSHVLSKILVKIPEAKRDIMAYMEEIGAENKELKDGK